jgi:hypothetical protein
MSVSMRPPPSALAWWKKWWMPGTARARALDARRPGGAAEPQRRGALQAPDSFSARDKAIADGLAAERELFVELFSTRGSARGR